MKNKCYLFQWSVLGALGLGLLASACQKNAGKPDEEPEPTPVVSSSFDLLQRRILTPTCATSGCHASESDPTFGQHRLVLAAGQSYKNLVGVAPTNSTAKANGLLRAKPFNAQESLLYHKLNAAAGHHSGADYGNPMPLGKDLLTVGQIEFVRRWIEAGAPQTGSMVDSTLLDDKTPSVVPDAFEALKAPAAGEGFQVKLEPFSIKPSFERELFVRKPIGNTQDVYVSRFEVKMRANSHHFALYNFRVNQNLPTLNEIRDLRNPDNTYNLQTALSMQNHVYFIGVQSPYVDYAFPEGTALLVPANTTMDLNSHYVNKSASAMTGEVNVNLYTVDKSKVKTVVKTMDFVNTNLDIPAKKRVVITKEFPMSKPVKVLVLTSHTHKLGEKFVVRVKGGVHDGEVIYTSTNWEHPEIKTFTTPVQLAKGDALVSEITYNNTTDKNVNFGLSSEDEMGIIFGYYLEN
ncbi:hypothetical protein GCM10027347_42770 [Larkinella harenae]